MRDYTPESVSFTTFNKISMIREKDKKEGIKDKKTYFGKE